MENITEERRNQENLRLSEARYRGIVQDQTEFIDRFFPDTTLTFVNQAICQFMNCRAKDLVGKRFIEMLPEEERQGMQRSLEALSQQNPTGILEQRMIGGRGQMRWVYWTNRAIFDENGTIREYQGMGRDITDQRETADRISRYILQLEFISRKAMEFVHSTPDDDLYLIIARGVKSLCPDALVCVHSYERKTGSMKVEAMLEEDVRTRIREIMGKDPVGILVHPTPDVIDKTMDGVLHRIPTEAYVSCFAQSISEEVVSHLSEVLGPSDTYLMGLTHGKELYGEILLVLRKGNVLQHQHILETYLNQASVAVQRRVFQKELRKSREQYRRIIETSAEGIWVLDRDYRTTFVNSRLAEMLGYAPEELVGRQVEEFMEPEDIPAHHQRMLERQTGVSGRFEQRFRRKDGSLIWAMASATPIMEKGVFAGAFAMLTDITDQKLAEDALRESEETFRTMVSILPLPLSLIDGTGKYLYLNPAFTQVFGYTLEDIPDGKAWFARAFPEKDTRETAIRLWKEDAAEHPDGEVRPRTFRVGCKDGSFKDILFLPASTPGGLQLVVYQDLTGEKIHARLLECEDLYRDMVDDLKVGIYRSSGDPSGRFIWGNTGLISILGYESLADLQGVPVRDLFVKPGGRKELLKELREKKFVKNRLLTLRRKDGTQLTVSVTALAEFDEKGQLQFINGLVQEIGEKSKADS